ncbi:hypothetical protein N431DRAFT_434560 [Stipitochalara longipes BDJ]|nr:hypothetical protein N431DRAFT_434560 [Stipitochalara longipes BDJ]
MFELEIGQSCPRRESQGRRESTRWFFAPAAGLGFGKRLVYLTTSNRKSDHVAHGVS